MGPTRALLLSYIILYLSQNTLAQFVSIPWSNCSTASSIPNSPTQIRVSAVYAQLVQNPQLHLNFTIFGSTPDQIAGESDDENRLLATIFTTTSRLTFTVSSTTTAFCDSLRPPSPLPSINGTSNNYCPISPGGLAFSVTNPLRRKYELLSLNTRIRVVDSSSPARELLCLDISTSPLNAGELNSIYGHAALAFWVPVSITIAYWILIGLGRIASAWNRGQSADHQKFWSHFQRVGFVLASAISGEKFATEPALLRFCTPSMRDIMFHTQWCAALGMVAVQWPFFAYPVFAQAAWSTLVYNITLTQGSDSPSTRWNPLSTPSLPTPTGFGDQIIDQTSPIFVDPAVQNSLFNLPPNTHAGIESFAYSVGVRPQDLFGLSMGLFLIIAAGIIVISSFIWAVDKLLCSITGISNERRFLPVSQGHRRWSLGARDAMVKPASQSALKDSQDDNLSNPLATSRALSRAPKQVSWWKPRFRQESFHRDALCGNLVRVLLLFHLPITIFSAYEFSRSRSQTTLTPTVLAVLSFVFFSLCIPSFLVFRLSTTKAKKLYDDTRTLLALGPLYNQYASGSQTFAKLFFVSNITLGVVVGCGQHSGTAQAIVILVAEVIAALWTSVYLPWGRGAAMGTLSFLMCVARIITGVLLVILSPTVSVGVAAGSWIAAAILLLQAIIYGLFLVMFAGKLFEGFLRLTFRIPFSRSRLAVDSGLVGVLGLIGLFGRRHRKNMKTPRYMPAHTTMQRTLSSQDVVGKSSYETPFIATPPRGPPSVLRVEQIGTPYKEEADDETGHILDAWPPIGESAEPTKAAGPSQPKSGFTRIRGGRANFDSPYSIMPITSEAESGQKQGIGQGREGPGYSRQSELPKGAMSPTAPAVHVRQKSETGIIGDFSSLQSQSQSHLSRQIFPVQGQTQNQAHIPPSSPTPNYPYPYEDDDDDDDDEGDYPPKKRRWFGRRTVSSDEPRRFPWDFIRERNRSERVESMSPAHETPLEPSAGPSKSFVVVRNKLSGSNRPSG